MVFEPLWSEKAGIYFDHFGLKLGVVLRERDLKSVQHSQV